jgi:hypothetical protein
MYYLIASAKIVLSAKQAKIFCIFFRATASKYFRLEKPARRIPAHRLALSRRDKKEYVLLFRRRSPTCGYGNNVLRTW